MPRKQHNIHYIYKTTCNVTGRYYIGMHSTSNIDDGYMGSGKRLRRSIRKYGEENHTKEIIEFFETREELIEAEKRMITEEHLSHDLCMNLMSGGTGGFISEEQQRHRSVCANKARQNKYKNDPKFKKYLPLRISDGLKKLYENGYINKNFNCDWTGKKHSEETKQKMSVSSKGQGVGETNSQYGTCWVTKNSENKKIKKEDLDKWINNGWKLGRFSRSGGPLTFGKR